MKKNDFGGLRWMPCVVFVAAIWVGCRMYHVCGNEKVESWDFHTKKEAEKFIRDNFSGNEMKIRLYDLKNCAIFYSPKNVKKY